MNPRLVPIAVALGYALLVLYVGTFIWFAYTALAGTGTAVIALQAGPLTGSANEAIAYIWTAASLLVGGVVAVAFGQTPPKGAAETSAEKLVVYYAWTFVGVGLAAAAVWIFASGAGRGADASLLIKNAAVAFFGLAVPILTAFLRLPPQSEDQSRGLIASVGVRRTINLCADFSLFSDNAPMPSSFKLAGFAFDQAPTGRSWFVTKSGERGLQFHPAGGRVQLPAAVPAVDLRVGAFAGSFDLEGVDAAGNVVARATVAGTNSWTDQRLTASGLAAVIFRGGGGESAIQKICVKLDCSHHG